MKKFILMMAVIIALTAGISPALALADETGEELAEVHLFVNNLATPDYDGTVVIGLQQTMTPDGDEVIGAVRIVLRYAQEQIIAGIPAALELMPGEYAVTVDFMPCEALCEACLGEYKLIDAMGEIADTLAVIDFGVTEVWDFVYADAETVKPARTDVKAGTEMPEPTPTPTSEPTSAPTPAPEPAAVADTDDDTDGGALEPLAELAKETGRDLAGMWVSIVILVIAGGAFLVVYLKRKSLNLKLGDD